MLKFYGRVDEDDWNSNRDDKQSEIEDQADMNRGEWEYNQDVEDYGPTYEDLDSGDNQD